MLCWIDGYFSMVYKLPQKKIRCISIAWVYSTSLSKGCLNNIITWLAIFHLFECKKNALYKPEMAQRQLSQLCMKYAWRMMVYLESSLKSVDCLLRCTIYTFTFYLFTLETHHYCVCSISKENCQWFFFSYVIKPCTIKLLVPCSPELEIECAVQSLLIV